MGDTFTESLPADWLAEHLEAMAEAPHVWILLTKRPQKMQEFFRKHPPPPNVWLLASVTSAGQERRAAIMAEMADEFPANVVGLSIEPLLTGINTARMNLARMRWVIVGGESNQPPHAARPFCLTWLRDIQAATLPTALFVKQLGSDVRESETGGRVRLRDGHGGNWDEWPEWAKVRQMPAYAPVRRSPVSA
jgi:protein gp37